VTAKPDGRCCHADQAASHHPRPPEKRKLPKAPPVQPSRHVSMMQHRPDPSDGFCQVAVVIATSNLDDFPAEALEPFGIEAKTPSVSVSW
jgi:hypothetical protein